MSRQNVVVVEDDRLLAEHFSRVLTRAGFAVTTCDNAIAAIDVIDEARPAALVVDVLLPAATIFALLNELQSHPDLKDIPVIVVSNLADQLSLDDLAPYGVRRLLDKSTMQPGELAAAVRSVVS